jgi:DNA-directed RNA polymerase subunit K/omega
MPVKAINAKKKPIIEESDSEEESDIENNTSDESDSDEESDQNFAEENNEIDEDELLGDEVSEDENETGQTIDVDTELISQNKKKNEDEDDDENDEDGEDLNLDCLLETNDEEDIYVEPQEATIKISLPKLTKYERVRILGMRTKQLALGAPPLVKNVSNKSPIEIAEIELMMNMIPFKLKRPLPNNTFEIWKLSELEK